MSMRKALQPILTYRSLMLSLTRYYRQISNRHYNYYLLAFIVASINEVTLRTLKSLVVYDFETKMRLYQSLCPEVFNTSPDYYRD